LEIGMITRARTGSLPRRNGAARHSHAELRGRQAFGRNGRHPDRRGSNRAV